MKIFKFQIYHNKLFLKFSGFIWQHCIWWWFHAIMTQYTIDTLRLRQDDCLFADNIFRGIFYNENVWISIKISQKFVPEGPMNNIPAFLQIWLGADQATSHYLNQWWLHYRHIFVTRPQWGNSLGPRSTLAQVLEFCLKAPSHYLNQCWLMISGVLWHSPDSNFTENTQDI